MNYLAHLYLSGTDSGIKVGNFIGDYVKGSNHQRYAPNIQTGILLHRHIDTFTDSHPIVKESRNVFKPSYRRYSGVVIDVVYDHFLAANWDMYAQQSLKSFVSESHRILMMHYFSLPGTVKQFLPFLIKSRRMEYYNKPEGVHRTLYLMAGHSSLPDHSDWALQQLFAHYEPLKEMFYQFFKELMEMSEGYLNEASYLRRQAI